MTGFRTLTPIPGRLSYGAPPTPVVPIERVRRTGALPTPKPAGAVSRTLARMIGAASPEPVPAVLVPTPRVKTPARMVRTLPAPPVRPEGETAPKVADCFAVVAGATGISVAKMKGPSRVADIVKARQSAAFIAKRFTARSLPDIGRRLGDRDHTTILHACRKVEAVVGVIGMPVDDSVEGWAIFLHGRDWPKAKALRA